MTEKTDEEVAARVQHGDTEAFGILVARYEAKMLRYARKFVRDADDMADVVQEVFIKAYINIKSFRIAERFSPWIYRIAHNEFINALKKKRSIPFSFFDFEADAFFPHLTAPDKTDQVSSERILKEAIEKCLDQLDAKYREILVLSYFEELQYEEISDVLHIPVSTVGVRLLRAKEKLKKIYQEKYARYE